jgi:hypothetical protein
LQPKSRARKVVSFAVRSNHALECRTARGHRRGDIYENLPSLCVATAARHSAQPLDFGMLWHRTLAAFLVAPAVGILTAWLIAFCIWAMPLGFAFSLVPLAYGLTVVIALPAFLALRRWPLRFAGLWWYLIAGFVVACFVAGPLLLTGNSTAASLGILVLVGGLTGGSAFGLISRPKSNQRLERP